MRAERVGNLEVRQVEIADLKATVLARLLDDQGVQVRAVDDLDPATAAPGRTVFVAFPERMSTRQRDALAAIDAKLAIEGTR